jgi:non-canonical (house-cleaning) NTP pyrophosphatase
MPFACFLVQDDIRNQQANERARIIRELRQADELQEALENVSNTQTLRQANELLWNRISYAVALTGAQDFAHAVESGVQADKDRQLQLVMSRSGAYKGGFALPPTAVRQMFPPFGMSFSHR